MCLHRIKVVSKNQNMVNKAWVPCGECRECRQNKAKQWEKRLNIEIDEYVIKRGWNCGFMTLTYREEMLPKIPRIYYTFSEKEYKKQPCFKYEDIKRFTDCIRNWLFREKKLTDAFRNITVCEYGKKGKRPHYHTLMWWNQKVTHEEMYLAIEDAWRGTEKIIKQNKLKRKRRDLGQIAPFNTFKVNNLQAITKYVCKYICKDLSFMEQMNDIDKKKLSKKNKNKLRHFEPFHKQSLNFGKTNNEEMIKIFEEGKASTATQKIETAPEYIKNKVLFQNYKYCSIKDRKEHQGKIATEYFKENKEKVYKIKLKKLEKKYEELGKEEHWINNREKKQQQGNGEHEVIEIIKEIGANELAKYECLYYGLDYNRALFDETEANTLYRRYNPIADDKKAININAKYYTLMNRAVERINSYTRLNYVPIKTEEDNLIEELREFYKKY